MVKIWFISDTHTMHEQLEIPTDIDWVIHCGDEANSKDPLRNYQESIRFFEWYDALDIPIKIFVPGNHSTAIYNNLLDPKELFPNIITLIHEEIQIGPYKIFGSPYTPAYGQSWAYMKKRNRMEMVWRTLPDEIDILLTHGPPKTVLDLTKDIETDQLVQAGCKSLMNYVQKIKPLIHAFGHFHDEDSIKNNGIFIKNDIKFINCALTFHKAKNPYLVNNGYIVYKLD